MCVFSWAWLRNSITDIDNEARELNRQTRCVKYRVHIGHGIYVSVTEGFACVDIRQFYLPYGANAGDERTSKRGIAIRLDEWSQFLNLVPAIDAGNMLLADTKPCYENDDHIEQLGFLRCGGCNPFACDDWQ